MSKKRYEKLWLSKETVENLAGGERELRCLNARQSIHYEGKIASFTTGAILVREKKNGKWCYYLFATNPEQIDALFTSAGEVKNPFFSEDQDQS